MTTDSGEKGAREFWLQDRAHGIDGIFYGKKNQSSFFNLRVIEYSAYDALAQKLKEVEEENKSLVIKNCMAEAGKELAWLNCEYCKKHQEANGYLRESLAIAVEALEFYAKPLDHEWDQNHKELWSDNEYRKFGSKSREALAKIREKHGELK